MAFPSILAPAEPLASTNNHKDVQRMLNRRARKTSLVFWSFVAPLLIGLLVFVYAPIVWSVILSFFNARNTITPTDFAGFANYASMLKDVGFTNALLSFSIFALFIIPTTFVFSLGLALLVNSVRFARGFFRSVFFIPTACSYVVASLIWKMSLFNGLPYGVANLVLSFFGLSRIAWIATANPPWFWLVLVTARLWLQLGFYMILFIAGLQDIPKELYEASFVDGAKKGWMTFRYITFPLLRNTSVSVLLLNIIAAYQAFDEFYNIMGSFNGSSGNAILARPPLVYLYGIAMGQQDYGRGSAGAVILTLIIVIFTVIQGRLFGFGRSAR